MRSRHRSIWCSLMDGAPVLKAWLVVWCFLRWDLDCSMDALWGKVIRRWKELRFGSCSGGFTVKYRLFLRRWFSVGWRRGGVETRVSSSVRISTHIQVIVILRHMVRIESRGFRFVVVWAYGSYGFILALCVLGFLLLCVMYLSLIFLGLTLNNKIN